MVIEPPKKPPGRQPPPPPRDELEAATRGLKGFNKKSIEPLYREHSKFKRWFWRIFYIVLIGGGYWTSTTDNARVAAIRSKVINSPVVKQVIGTDPPPTTLPLVAKVIATNPPLTTTTTAASTTRAFVVNTHPAGGEIFINGHDMGVRSPATLQIPKSGSFTIEVHLQGFADFSAMLGAGHDSVTIDLRSQQFQIR